jgi:pimeloyl-ACP methyl ester carboxylesterase
MLGACLTGRFTGLDRASFANLLHPPDRAWAIGTRIGNRWVPVDGAELRVRTAGTGERCVVFAIDPPNTVEHYDDLVRELATDHRVVCVELPGFGFSTATRAFDFSPAAYARVVTQMLDALDVRPAVLAFPCIWAYVAIAVATAEPRRVAGVVAMQAPCWSDEVAWSRRIDSSQLIRQPGIGQLVMHAARYRVAQRWYRAALPRGAPREPFEEPAIAALAHGGGFALGSLAQAWFGSATLDLEVPIQRVVAVWGDADRTHRRSRPNSVLDHATGGHSVSLAGRGHFPELEDPTAVAALVRSFWPSA